LPLDESSGAGQKLKEYSDHPFHGIALAIIRGGKGEWGVITQRRLPKREPNLAKRVRAIEKQLQ
jgi:hypothetical protein